MEDSGNKNREAESPSTSTPRPSKEAVHPTNLPTTIPREFLEQMLKALRPDLDVAQTLVGLEQPDQPRISTATQETVTLPTHTMTSATEGLARGGGEPTEETTEVVAEEEPLQQPIRTEVEAQTDLSRGTTADAENPEQCDPSGREIIPLRMDDFPGQPTSPLPALSPPDERAYTEERVPRLEGPSR